MPCTEEDTLRRIGLFLVTGARDTQGHEAIGAEQRDHREFRSFAIVSTITRVGAWLMAVDGEGRYWMAFVSQDERENGVWQRYLQEQGFHPSANARGLEGVARSFEALPVPEAVRLATGKS